MTSSRISYLARTSGYIACGFASLIGDNANNVFPAVCVVTAVSLLGRVVGVLRGGSLSPIAMWELGFMWILVPEWAQRREDYEVALGSQNVASAVSLLVLGHCVVVIIVDAMTAGAPEGRDGKWSRMTSAFPDPLVLGGIITVALLVWIPRTVQAGLIGRSAEVDAGGTGALGTLALFAGLSAPVLIAARLSRSGRPWLVKALVLGLPFMAAAAISGSRFYLLFAVLPPIAMWFFGSRATPVRVVAVVAGSVLVLGLTSLMLTSRQAGLESYAAGSASSADRSVLRSEGVIEANARLANFFENHDHRGGASTKAVLTSVVPRVLWPDKPTLLGNWFPQAADYGTSASHSVAFGYVGEGYSDVGALGAVLEAIIIGCLLGWIAVKTSSARSRQGLCLRAVTFPVFFFAFRSPVTGLIVVFGIYILIWLAGAPGWARESQRSADPVGPFFPNGFKPNARG